MYRAKDFDEALTKAERLVEDGGYGHTAALYIHPAQKEKIMKHAEAMKACPNPDQHPIGSRWYR